MSKETTPTINKPSVKMYNTLLVFFEGDKSVFRLRIPLIGGKAGRGHAKTSNVQVLNTKTGSVIKQFRFNVDNFDSKVSAQRKAVKFVESL